MTPYWVECFGNPHSANHIIGWRAAEAVQEAKEAVAVMIGADANEIVLTSGATEANNLALLGLGNGTDDRRRRILVSEIEHKCVLAAATAVAAQRGFTLQTIPVDHAGFVDLDWLSSEVDETVLVVSVMAVNNEIGTIQDIASITSLLEPHGALFHCDAAQAPCAMDVRDLASHVDLISLSGHKFYGPQGIGALRVRRELSGHLEPIIHGGGQQDGLRSGTIPVALSVGMGAAAEIMSSDRERLDRKRVEALRDRFIQKLQQESIRFQVCGPSGTRRHPGNANLRFQGFDALDILARLQPRLAASTGSACTSGIPEPSHVLRALGLSGEEAESSIRFSFGRFSTEAEVDDAARLLIAALSRSSGKMCR